jgi:hypothetical protein
MSNSNDNIDNLAQTFFVTLVFTSLLSDSYIVCSDFMKNDFIKKKLNYAKKIFNIVTGLSFNKYKNDEDGNIIIDNKVSTNPFDIDMTEDDDDDILIGDDYDENNCNINLKKIETNIKEKKEILDTSYYGKLRVTEKHINPNISEQKVIKDQIFQESKNDSNFTTLVCDKKSVEKIEIIENKTEKKNIKNIEINNKNIEINNKNIEIDNKNIEIDNKKEIDEKKKKKIENIQKKEIEKEIDNSKNKIKSKKDKNTINPGYIHESGSINEHIISNDDSTILRKKKKDKV